MNTKSDISIHSELRFHVDGIPKVINIIDRVRRKERQGKDGIHYLCCHELAYRYHGRNLEIMRLLKKHRKNSYNAEAKAALLEHARYQEVRKKWNPEELAKLVAVKKICFDYKLLGRRLKMEKIDKIQIKDATLIEVLKNFKFLFPKVEEQFAGTEAGRNPNTITIRSPAYRGVFFIDKAKHIDILHPITSFTSLCITHERFTYHQDDQYRKPENHEHE